MRFPAVCVFASIIKLQEEMPMEACSIYNFVKFCQTRIIAQSAQWSTGTNGTFYHTRNAFLDVGNTR